MGSSIGHEFGHSFDNFDELEFDNSNFYKNWTTEKEFLNRSSCFSKQYGQYELEGMGIKVSDLKCELLFFTQ